MRNRDLILVACMASLALVACGKSPGERAAEAAIEQATGNKATVDADGNAVTIKTDEGEMKMSGGEDAKLPASFPKDVYLPKDYVVESSMEMPGALVVSLDTKGKMSALADDAGKHMAAQGWKQGFTMQNAADSQMTVYEKDNRTATVSFATEGDKVKLGLQIATQKQ